eukprot:GHVU01138562.1.p1 GENE.GHVU01138562.1~~GHVU01138562.1.p1  ORF type:complete len:435 (-),score=58.02 GHVU01138562.1:327-1631(-)
MDGESSYLITVRFQSASESEGAQRGCIGTSSKGPPSDPSIRTKGTLRLFVDGFRADAKLVTLTATAWRPQVCMKPQHRIEFQPTCVGGRSTTRVKLANPTGLALRYRLSITGQRVAMGSGGGLGSSLPTRHPQGGGPVSPGTLPSDEAAELADGDWSDLQSEGFVEDAEETQFGLLVDSEDGEGEEEEGNSADGDESTGGAESTMRTTCVGTLQPWASSSVSLFYAPTARGSTASAGGNRRRQQAACRHHGTVLLSAHLLLLEEGRPCGPTAAGLTLDPEHYEYQTEATLSAECVGSSIIFENCDMGVVAVGSSAAAEVKMTNQGRASIPYRFVIETLSGPPENEFQVSPMTGELHAEVTDSVRVMLKARRQGRCRYRVGVVTSEERCGALEFFEVCVDVQQPGLEVVRVEYYGPQILSAPLLEQRVAVEGFNA